MQEQPSQNLIHPSPCQRQPYSGLTTMPDRETPRGTLGHPRRLSPTDSSFSSQRFAPWKKHVLMQPTLKEPPVYCRRDSGDGRVGVLMLAPPRQLMLSRRVSPRPLFVLETLKLQQHGRPHPLLQDATRIRVTLLSAIASP